ncbi:MAG: flagellar export chaperone FliS [Pseudomonadales bacterium]|jgi:flagellar protein FliS
MSFAMKQYARIGTQASIQDASPHRLIQMLFRGALDRMAGARGAMENEDVVRKGELIGKAISIVGGLRDAVIEDGGALAQNLDALYEYIANRLVVANLQNDMDVLQECMDLLTPIASAWDDIAPERVKDAPAQG